MEGSICRKWVNARSALILKQLYQFVNYTSLQIGVCNLNLTFVLVTQKNRLMGTVLFSTQNI